MINLANAIAVVAIVMSATTAPSAANETVEGARADCAEQWPNDYAMQEFCFTRQGKAFINMQKVHQSAQSEAHSDIMYRCAEKWVTTNGFDWPMVEFCYNRQLAAHDRLNPPE